MSGSFEYEADRGFIPASSANSPEFLVMVDGYYCVDISGKGGLCSTRIRRLKDSVIEILPQSYSYKLHFLCSKSLDFEFSQDVKKEEKNTIRIPQQKYSNVDTFVCIGEVFPDDREDKVSASFEIRYRVLANDYVEADEIKYKDNTFFLGRYSLYSKIYDQGKWKFFKAKYELEAKDRYAPVVSETYNMRYSYRNF